MAAGSVSRSKLFPDLKLGKPSAKPALDGPVSSAYWTALQSQREMLFRNAALEERIEELEKRKGELMREARGRDHASSKRNLVRGASEAQDASSEEGENQRLTNRYSDFYDEDYYTDYEPKFQNADDEGEEGDDSREEGEDDDDDPDPHVKSGSAWRYTRNAKPGEKAIRALPNRARNSGHCEPNKKIEIQPVTQPETLAAKDCKQDKCNCPGQLKLDSLNLSSHPIEDQKKILASQIQAQLRQRQGLMDQKAALEAQLRSAGKIPGDIENVQAQYSEDGVARNGSASSSRVSKKRKSHVIPSLQNLDVVPPVGLDPPSFTSKNSSSSTSAPAHPTTSSVLASSYIPIPDWEKRQRARVRYCLRHWNSSERADLPRWKAGVDKVVRECTYANLAPPLRPEVTDALQAVSGILLYSALAKRRKWHQANKTLTKDKQPSPSRPRSPWEHQKFNFSRRSTSTTALEILQAQLTIVCLAIERAYTDSEIAAVNAAKALTDHEAKDPPARTIITISTQTEDPSQLVYFDCITAKEPTPIKSLKTEEEVKISGKAKKKKNTKANAANPHHAWNLIPPPMGSKNHGQLNSSELDSFAQLAFRFLSASIPRSKKLNASSDPRDEWICGMCEYELFFTPDHSTLRDNAVERRRRILERKAKAAQRASRAVDGKGNGIKGKSERRTLNRARMKNASTQTNDDDGSDVQDRNHASETGEDVGARQVENIKDRPLPSIPPPIDGR